MPWQPGLRLCNRFRLNEALGRGAFGDVWSAIDDQTGTTVAIKIASTSPGAVERLRHEDKMLLAERANPHVIQRVTASEWYGVPYIVLEYAEGRSLDEWVRTRHSWEEVACVLHCAALGLAPMHARGGWHRDIKPANLLLVHLPNGEWTVKLGDLGLARVPDAASGMRTQFAHGTPHYVAPEAMLSNHFDARSDIFALGTTGIALLTGATAPMGLLGANGPDRLKDLLRSMVSDAIQRPTIEQVVAEIAAIRFPTSAQPVARPAVAQNANRGWVGPALGLAGLFGAVALAAAPRNDPRVGRYRGRDGQFKSWGI